jgi:hypothetical protein
VTPFVASQVIVNVAVAVVSSPPKSTQPISGEVPATPVSL